MSRKAKVDHDRLVMVALTLADEVGFDAISLADMAAAVDMRIPSLYNHIAGLEDVKRAVVLASLTSLAQTLRIATTGRAGDDAIRALADAYRAFAHRHPGWYDAIQAARHYEDDAVIAAGREPVEVVITILAHYHLQADDALHAVRVLRSILHGFVSLELGHGFGLPLDIDETYHRLIALLLEGISR